MPSSRQTRPRRPDVTPEFIAAFARMMTVIAFKKACHTQAWKTAWADGSRSCGPAEFDAAEAAVIASGHARPPEEWFTPDPIVTAWYRGEAEDSPPPKGSGRSSR